MFVIMMAFGASVVVREYVVTVTQVKGISMENTLIENDRVYLWNFGKVKAGDIVRLDNPEYNPEKGDKYIIKRVIALAGDEVKIPGDGFVYVNGEKIEENYTKHYDLPFGSKIYEGKGDNDDDKEEKIYEGTKYRRGDSVQSRSKYENGGIVPDGCVFVLGDNRTISADSRTFGEFKEETIHGRAFLIMRDIKDGEKTKTIKIWLK
jgi:signal peptidase I